MVLPLLPKRELSSYKGTFGRALLIGGSRGMAGAVALAGMSAIRAGAGLTTVAVPDCCLETVAAFDPCYMTVPVSNDSQGRISSAAIERLLATGTQATSVGMGPGLSTSDELTQVVLRLYSDLDCPMVVDADALNALATLPRGNVRTTLPRVLTPHVGEFRRLVKGTEFEADSRLRTPVECEEAAVQFAEATGVVLVLKGHQTLVTDGRDSYRNTTGNPGMATGGSGDVLTGVIAALLAQGLSAFDAAALAVHLHGLAGDLARDTKGEVSMSAEDIKNHLADAFRSYASQS